MATNYLVAWDSDRSRGIERGTFGCSARGPAEAIGEFEKSMHARALPREPLQVRAYGPEQNPLQAPAREDALQASVIEPAPFRVRYGDPRLDTAGRAEIAVEIDGRYCGKLREVDAGAGWRAFSPRGELDGLGPPPPPEWPVPETPPMTLAAACRGVERLAAAEREKWKSDPGWHLRPPAPRPPADPDPDRPVRFWPPSVDSHGRASVAVEINGRLSATLREAPPGDEGARWSVSWSQLPPGDPRIAWLDQVGKSKPLSLAEACREVEAAVRSRHTRTSAAERARAATAAPATRERCR